MPDQARHDEGEGKSGIRGKGASALPRAHHQQVDIRRAGLLELVEQALEPRLELLAAGLAQGQAGAQQAEGAFGILGAGEQLLDIGARDPAALAGAAASPPNAAGLTAKRRATVSKLRSITARRFTSPATRMRPAASSRSTWW